MRGRLSKANNVRKSLAEEIVLAPFSFLNNVALSSDQFSIDLWQHWSGTDSETQHGTSHFTSDDMSNSISRHCNVRSALSVISYENIHGSVHKGSSQNQRRGVARTDPVDNLIGRLPHVLE